MRRRATNRPVSTTTARMQKPSTGLGMLPSRPRNPLREPRSKPNSTGSGTGEPVDPAPNVLLAKPNCSMATAAANVTTANDTPRTRNAETPVMNPRMVATAMPAIAPIGKSIPRSVAKCETVKPAAPARATCASDTCPT